MRNPFKRGPSPLEKRVTTLEQEMLVLRRTLSPMELNDGSKRYFTENVPVAGSMVTKPNPANFGPTQEESDEDKNLRKVMLTEYSKGER